MALVRSPGFLSAAGPGAVTGAPWVNPSSGLAMPSRTPATERSRNASWPGNRASERPGELVTVGVEALLASVSRISDRATPRPWALTQGRGGGGAGYDVGVAAGVP